MLSKTKKGLLVGAVAAALVAGGALSATAATTSTTITGCLTPGTGQLRVLDGGGQCKANETPISWNETGPQGEPGPTGPQGPAGETGPAGAPGVSSDGYFAHGETGPGVSLSNGQRYEIVRLADLPSGSYIVGYAATGAVGSSGEDEVPMLACELVAGGAVLSTAKESAANVETDVTEVFGDGAFYGEGTLAGTHGVTVPANATEDVSVFCTMQYSDSASFKADLTAVKVAAVH